MCCSVDDGEIAGEGARASVDDDDEGEDEEGASFLVVPDCIPSRYPNNNVDMKKNAISNARGIEPHVDGFSDVICIGRRSFSSSSISSSSIGSSSAIFHESMEEWYGKTYKPRRSKSIRSEALERGSKRAAPSKRKRSASRSANLQNVANLKQMLTRRVGGGAGATSPRDASRRREGNE